MLLLEMHYVGGFLCYNDGKVRSFWLVLCFVGNALAVGCHEVLALLKRFVVPVIALLIPIALQLSGYQNLTLAIGILLIAGLWGLLALITWKPFTEVLPSPRMFSRSSGLEIKFCDVEGRWINNPPEALFWQVSSGMITYFVSGFFRLSNLSKTERTIESAYLLLKASGKELKRAIVEQMPVGERILSLDTTKTAIRFHMQFMVDQYELQKLVGLEYEKAELSLVVEATGSRATAKFRNHYGSPVPS